VKLPGRLQQTTLGDVLGALHRDRATGVLELVEPAGPGGGAVHRVHLRDGLVLEVESRSRVPRLGEILRREGLVGAQSAPALERVALVASPKPYGQRLVDARVATAESVLHALRQQTRARLDALFSLRDARLAFHVARRGGDRAPSPLGPKEFLHGRRRARGASGDAPRRKDPVRARALSTLGLSANAGRDDVQRAFRKLAGTTHPDRFPHASAEERARLLKRFAELSAAYHALVA
jgi:hypothetical protein